MKTCVLTQRNNISGLACVCVCVRVCMCAGKKENWAQGSRDFGVTARKCLGRWGAGPSCLVYDSPGHVTTCSHRSTGQSETRGQRVKPARLFIVCAGCLTAECRQISPEVSASIHKCKLAWTRQDRGSTVPTCFWELAQWQWSAFPPHLSVCMSPLSGSVFCCLSWWQGEEGNTSLPLFFLTQVRLQIL